MNIEKQIREDHHAQLTVQVEADRLEGIKRRAASRLARRVKIPGFRPGKAPYPVIVRHLGEAAILEEAIELLVAEIYPEVIKETGINPYGPGKLENVSATEPLTLEFSVPLKAEAVLGDYHSIKIAYELEQVADQDVNDVLEDLRERHAIIEPVDRAAQVGDLVTMKLRATGLAADAEPAVELIPERSSSVIIRPEDASSKPGAWPFPGFSHHLIGMRAGDEKLLEYTFPEDSLYEALRGVQAQFYVKIEAVKSRQLPELDDDFAKTVGEYDTLEALKADIRESLEEQARTAYHKVYDEKILDAAIEQTTFKYPPEMVDDEVDTLINELQQRLERQGMDIDLYLKSRGIDMKAFREEVRPIAEDRIKRALFLVEFGKAEKVEVKPEELEQEAMQKGIEPVLINVREKDQMKQQKAYLGASLSMGEGSESIPFLQPGGAMEYALTTAIKKLSVTDKPYVAMIVGHGEPTLDQLFQVMQSMSVLYNFQAFKMDSTITDIPDNYKTIAIVNPTDSIPPAHLAAFDRFLERGGKVYVGINRVNGDLQNSYGTAVSTGLETWLRNKGIEVDEYFVTDANCGSVTVQQVQGMMRYSSQVSFPYLPVSLKFADHPVTRGLESVYFPFVSPVIFKGDTSQFRFTPVVFSSEKASMLRAPQFFDIRKQWTQQDFPQKNITLAAAIEKKESDGWKPMMFVAGDGDFAINGPREQAQQLMPDNVNLMVNAIDWLSDETGLIELRTRGIATRPIDTTLEDSTKTLLKWVNFLLPILLIMLFGVYRFWRMKAIRNRRMEERYE